MVEDYNINDLKLEPVEETKFPVWLERAPENTRLYKAKVPQWKIKKGKVKDGVIQKDTRINIGTRDFFAGPLFAKTDEKEKEKTKTTSELTIVTPLFEHFETLGPGKKYIVFFPFNTNRTKEEGTNEMKIYAYNCILALDRQNPLPFKYKYNPPTVRLMKLLSADDVKDLIKVVTETTMQVPDNTSQPIRDNFLLDFNKLCELYGRIRDFDATTIPGSGRHIPSTYDLKMPHVPYTPDTMTDWMTLNFNHVKYFTLLELQAKIIHRILYYFQDENKTTKHMNLDILNMLRPPFRTAYFIAFLNDLAYVFNYTWRFFQSFGYTLPTLAAHYDRDAYFMFHGRLNLGLANKTPLEAESHGLAKPVKTEWTKVTPRDFNAESKNRHLLTTTSSSSSSSSTNVPIPAASLNKSAPPPSKFTKFQQILRPIPRIL